MKSFILRIFSLVLLGIVSIPTIAQQGKLLLWNTLDNREAVENSEVGPGIIQTTYKFPLWGEAQIVPAKFGNGLYINHDTEEGFKNDGGNFFAIDNEAMGLTAERGAIEFWMTFMYDCTERNHAPMIMMNDQLIGHYENYPGENIGAFFLLIWNGWNYGNRYGKRYAISAGYDTEGWAFNEYTADFSTYPGGDLAFHKGETAHFALAWDVNGISGHEANVILFVNGIPVATIKGQWDTTKGIRNYTYLGTTPNDGNNDHYYNAFNGVYDNLKIWGYAKTDYSDSGVPPVTKRTIYRSESAGDQEVPEGLIFWNSLDSKEEVANSVWGPDIQQTTYMFPLWGEARIEPASFSNGLFINHDDGGGQANDGGNFFAIDNREMQMSPTQGTIEFLFKFGEDYTYKSQSPHRTDSVYYAFLFAMHNVLSGRFTGDEILDETGLKMQLIWDGRSNVRRYLFQVARADLGIWNNGWTSANQSDNVKFKKGEIAHFAFMWDLNGLEGGNRTSALYINGRMEAYTTGKWPEDSEIRNYTYLGALPGSPYYGTDHSWSAFIGVIDNIKIWDRPLLQQEFTDNARTFEGFVEWPLQSVIVDDGDLSPEKVGYPKAWTLCDGEIGYEYTDSWGSYQGRTIIERYWTITDACGGFAQVIQNIEFKELEPRISGFGFINPVTEGTVGYMTPSNYPHYHFLVDQWQTNLMADANELTKSVVFQLNGQWERTENYAPFAIGGDRNGDYMRWDINNGVHYVCATPYSEMNKKGVAGDKECINLSLIFTLPEEMSGSGSIWAKKGSNRLNQMAEGYANYEFDVSFDWNTREFDGTANFTIPGGTEVEIVDIFHYFQRTTNATLFFRANVNGDPGYVAYLRFVYRPNKTLGRLMIYELNGSDVVFDTEFPLPRYTTPTVSVENEVLEMSEPIRAAMNDEGFEDLVLIDELQVYPNPFGNYISLVIPTYEGYPWVGMKLIDTQGRVMLERNLATGREHTIDTSNLGRGVYLLQLNLPGEQRAVRLVK